MTSAERWAARALAVLERTEQAITFAAFALLVVVLFADVAVRELTGAGLTWSRQLGVYANLFLTLVGIGVASAAGAHLRPRFADHWLPASWDAALETLRDAVMAVFCAGVAAVSVMVVAETRALEERVVVLNWLVWPFQVVIPTVFLAAAIRHGLYAAFAGLRPRDLQEVAGVESESAKRESNQP
jgi:TRAP-type C4-dicarboxylate transport system permease small subunit